MSESLPWQAEINEETIQTFMKNIIFVMLLVSLLLTGCLGGKQVATAYYLLEYPAGSASQFAADSAEVRFDKPVFINPVEIHPAFATHQIAIREGAYQINYFSFNEWATRPGQSLYILTSRFLSDHKWFSKLVDAPSAALQGYSLTVSIHRMEVAKVKQHFNTSLSMEFMLTDNQSGETTSSGLIDVRQGLESKNLNLFAAAVTAIYLDELNGFLDRVIRGDNHD
jgi:uncharacterized lipoprotein YmbA